MARELALSLSDEEAAVVETAAAEFDPRPTVDEWCAARLAEVIADRRQRQHHAIATQLADAFVKADPATQTAIRRELKLNAVDAEAAIDESEGDHEPA